QPNPALTAFVAARIWPLTAPGGGSLVEHAVIVDGGRIQSIVPRSDLRDGMTVHDFGDVDLVPGFIDVQVNGGGGVLFNDEPTVNGIRAIVQAHRRFGTTSMLPTFITDSAEQMARARAAIGAGVLVHARAYFL
ncbi:MAG: hypothetical protein L3J05_05440, partial [Robiginitomaculum sp.]|nr:hypothetical protein [Robiginitomaculum sp.]